MLHFSSFMSTLPYVALPILLYCMCGYFFLNKMLRINLRKTYGLWVSLPVYLSAGIVLYTFILYMIGLIVVNIYMVIILATAIPLLFLGNMLLSFGRSGTNTIETARDRLKEINKKKLPTLIVGKLPNTIAALPFFVSFLYISNVIAIVGWPPAGDIAYHGFYTSIIIYDQKIPANFLPFLNQRLNYPLGLHVNAAFLALLLGIYPGESVFLLGAILMIALTSLVFALTYILTGSKVLSISAYTLLYLTYSTSAGGGNLELWFFGYFFNGPYPNIFGFLIVLLSATATIIQAKTRDQYVLTRFLPILIIVILLTYPSLFFFPLALFIFVALQYGVKNTLQACFKTRKDILATSFLTILIIYFIPYTYSILTAQIAFGGAGGLFSQFYLVPPDYLFGSIFGVSIIFAFVTSCLLIAFSFIKAVRKSNLFRRDQLVKLRPLLLAYTLFVLVLFFSLNTGFFTLLQYLLPRRLTIVIMILSLVLNIYTLSRIFGILMNELFRFVFLEKRFAPNAIKNLLRFSTTARMRRSSFTEKLSGSTVMRRVRKLPLKKCFPVARNIAVALIVITLFNANGLLAYSLSSHASLDLAHNAAWFSHTASFQDDFKGMEWIHSNVKDGELILNDWSFAGTYLPSLSAKNVSMHYILIGLNRTSELQNIWLYPQNETLVYLLIREYNVTYIFSTSEQGYFDWTNWRYEGKPYAPHQYIEFFSNYSFLELAFRSGDTVIFTTR